jgi:hypothetical protein
MWRSAAALTEGELCFALACSFIASNAWVDTRRREDLQNASTGFEIGITGISLGGTRSKKNKKGQ